MNINFFTDAYPTTSFVDVIDNPSRSGMFAGKVVFVGVTAPRIHDQFLTPYDTKNLMSGVMIHVNLYNTLTAKRFIDYENIWQFLVVNAILIFICLCILVETSNFIHGVLYSFGVVVAYILLSLGTFWRFGTMLEIFPLIVSYGVISLVVYFKKFVHERKSKDQIREIFSRYVSEDVAHELIKTGIDSIKLG